jgi:hypothetical protein
VSDRDEWMGFIRRTVASGGSVGAAAVAALLEEIKAKGEALDTLLDQRNAILRLHYKADDDCGHCGVAWPCATSAIVGAKR